MKKQLILAFAICALFLSACGSLMGTSTSSSSSASHSTSLIASTSAQSVCHGLYDRQAQLSQTYHTARVQFNTAQAGGNWRQAGETEKILMQVHQSITQVQTQLKVC
jgi:hypothetical protein